MGKLLAGSAPLRGRAGLELVVPTLDYRLAREFWGIADLRPAGLTNAIVGGTPAYRREFAQDDAPADATDFDPWVCRTVLNPSRPLFREARYILAEEPDLHDTALYHAVLAAIAEGNNTRGGIAGYLERKSTDLAHPLGVLHDAGLITHETDAFRKNRSAYRIAEPLLTFYHAIMSPASGDLDRPPVGPRAPRPRHLREPIPRPRRQRNGIRPRSKEDAPDRCCRLRPRRGRPGHAARDRRGEMARNNHTWPPQETGAHPRPAPEARRTRS